MITNLLLDTKIKSAVYNKDTGVSTVVLSNELGNFTGVARCHPDDRGSRFIGCEIAEHRATIKVLKEQLRIAENQRKAFEIYVDTISQKKNYNPKTNEACHARRFLAEFENKVKSYKLYIKTINEDLKTLIDSIEENRQKIDNIAKKYEE